mmetsp:Transcript_83764/g.233623  ORF Transcript_83764/g.233623 Transcript_83764/m.233623 type:complete len:219 (+) Transcript_83764:91-747(+)
MTASGNDVKTPCDVPTAQPERMQLPLVSFLSMSMRRTGGSRQALFMSKWRLKPRSPTCTTHSFGTALTKFCSSTGRFTRRAWTASTSPVTRLVSPCPLRTPSSGLFDLHLLMVVAHTQCWARIPNASTSATQAEHAATAPRVRASGNARTWGQFRSQERVCAGAARERPPAIACRLQGPCRCTGKRKGSGPFTAEPPVGSQPPARAPWAGKHAAGQIR